MMTLVKSLPCTYMTSHDLLPEFQPFMYYRMELKFRKQHFRSVQLFFVCVWVKLLLEGNITKERKKERQKERKKE